MAENQKKFAEIMNEDQNKNTDILSGMELKLSHLSQDMKDDTSVKTTQASLDAVSAQNQKVLDSLAMSRVMFKHTQASNRFNTEGLRRRY